MSNVFSTIKREFMEMLPPTIFFLVALHIVALIRALMVRSAGIEIQTSASILLAALILGKAVLIANLLPFINRFPDKPLIWNVAWKTLIYALVALLVHYLERLYEYWKETPGLAAANQKLLLEINWAHFWAIQILLLTLIFSYCVIAELVRVIGREKFKRMFFGPLPERLSAPVSSRD
ncbi:hypothetical protein [Cupriavidus pauculus]|jgi:hypothetical protein|uniref:hypothetical protein n=1 Tax=Cupriavidus pauculus TaxID=82633 RepID=UPI00124471DE|nr:hypothetical protein [Cupriavidus pauculus]KAB0602900.1 hypothetical protein F7R19_10135 [Cupriavidus pauculus]MCM3609285.1 hypothetical protein [Cupriavidus pauculus]UAL03190.1 hypothetical protein K8O84_21300 [Cupriavidus pauculus]